MTDASTFLLFLVAAFVLAITPGPGIFYVAARTLSGGRAEGIASSFGTAIGGSVHVVGGAVGLSALLMASAEAFMVLKLVGAVYLIWLGIRTWRGALVPPPITVEATGAARAFREGIVVEILNPKTAAFFLAFIPQFVDLNGKIALQFIVLGLISVTLNTLADIVVAFWGAAARSGLQRWPRLLQRVRQASGGFMGALGLSLLLARRPT